MSVFLMLLLLYRNVGKLLLKHSLGNFASSRGNVRDNKERKSKTQRFGGNERHKLRKEKCTEKQEK
jgi:hypothetical protein